VLVLRDVLAFRAGEVAEMLGVTEVSVNRALHRGARISKHRRLTGTGASENQQRTTTMARGSRLLLVQALKRGRRLKRYEHMFYYRSPRVLPPPASGLADSNFTPARRANQSLKLTTNWY
jgi:hypothetical protein